MKRRLAGFLALCLALAMLLTAVPALAAGDATRYLMPGTDISLEIPEGWQMLTVEDDLTQDPIYGSQGTAEEIRDAWRENNNVMHAWKGEGSHVTLIVDTQPSDPRPLSEYSQAELDALSKQFSNSTTSGDVVDVLAWDNGTFLRITQTINGANGRVLYLGVVNGAMFALMVLDRNATVPQDVASEVEDMVRSMRFDGEAALAVPTQTYSVADLAITFQLPEDWTVSAGIQAPFAADSPDSQSRFLVLRSQGFGPAIMSMNAAEALPDLAQLQKLALGMARKAGGGELTVTGASYFPEGSRQFIQLTGTADGLPLTGYLTFHNGDAVLLAVLGQDGDIAQTAAQTLTYDGGGMPYALRQVILIVVLALLVLAAGVVLLVVLLHRRKGGKPSVPPAQPTSGDLSDPAPPASPEALPAEDPARSDSMPEEPSAWTPAQPQPPAEPTPIPPVEPEPAPPVETTAWTPAPTPAQPAWPDAPVSRDPGETPVEPEPAPVDLPRLRTCPHCNAFIPEESRFCPHCGQSISQ